MGRRSLSQALPLAERLGSLTDQIDIHLEYARLLIETGKADGARAALEKAGNLIDQETRRRDLQRRRREVAELQGRLEAGDVQPQADTAE
jgi:thioredoxin-like negative regulator of GroEL